MTRMDANLQNIRLQPLAYPGTGKIQMEVLRTDLLHPVVSGNKWFKLRYYIEEAKALQRGTIASFGGPYSNHLVATAYAAAAEGMQSIGYVRGEAPQIVSPTLAEARSYGMHLQFLDRTAFAEQKRSNAGRDGVYEIPEGGYGIKGAAGAATLLDSISPESYTHILCACGTGTMLAGLVKAAATNQQVIGISVLKNNFSIREEVMALLSEDEKRKPFHLLHDYHFGGYARHPESLLAFMRNLWEKEQLPTDIVYTSKLLYAALDLDRQSYFPAGSRVLLIHSGGLQGNRSLPPNSLPF